MVVILIQTQMLGFSLQFTIFRVSKYVEVRLKFSLENFVVVLTWRSYNGANTLILAKFLTKTTK